MPRYQTGVNVAVPPAGILSGAITAIQTTITLSDATIFPEPYPAYPIVVYATVSAVQHTEYMLVTGKSGNILTVVRAYEDASRYPAYAFPAVGDANTSINVDLGITAALLNSFASRRTEPVTAFLGRSPETLRLSTGDEVVATTLTTIRQPDFVVTSLGDIVIGGTPATPMYEPLVTGKAITEVISSEPITVFAPSTELVTISTGDLVVVEA